MTTVPVMPRVGEWTVDDLDALPDDGLQYELIDGILLVSPAPLIGHQRAARGLFRLLADTCPAEWEVFFAPLDFRPHRRTSVQPDLLVVARDQVGVENITGHVLLAVEVLSPSTRRKDLVLKHTVYADAGVASYWTFDPVEPAITCWDLADGGYHQVAAARGDAAAAVTRPYPLTLVPSVLAAG